MSRGTHRTIQIALLAFCLFFLLGGGLFRVRTLPGGTIETTTLTFYKTLPPPPKGPAFCKVLRLGNRGIVWPCDLKPPFLYWLRQRMAR